MKHLPLALAWFRLLTGIALPLLAILSCPRLGLALLFVLGFLSDIVDGMIARRLGISTLALRRFDSRADVGFVIGAVAAVGIATPEIFHEWLPWMYAYAGLFVCRNALDFWKYRASPSYHMWSGKLWALLVAAGILLGLNGQSPPLLPALSFMTYAWNAFEGMMATLLLPVPISDVRSLGQVLKIHRSKT